MGVHQGAMLAAAKHAMSLGMAHADGQYNVAMVKASNLDIVPPKEKHVRYLISWTNDYPAEDNLIAVFKSLCERLEEKDAIITLKALVVLHRILREGPISFTEVALARAGSLRMDQLKKTQEVELAGQLHQAGTPTLVAFIRRYAFYLQDRLYTWRSLGFDFLRQKPKQTEDRNLKEIIKRAQTLQRLLSSLYECESENLRGIPPKLAGVALLMKDAFRLYRLINEAVLEILEDYFSLDKETALEALQVYRRFDEQTNQQIKLYKLGRELPGGYQLESLPQLKKLSDQVIPTLEDYIRQLEDSGESPAPVSKVVLHADEPKKSPRSQGKKKKNVQPSPMKQDLEVNLMSAQQEEDLDDLLGNLDFGAPADPGPQAPQVNPFSASTMQQVAGQGAGQQGLNPFQSRAVDYSGQQQNMSQPMQAGMMGGGMQPAANNPFARQPAPGTFGAQMMQQPAPGMLQPGQTQYQQPLMPTQQPQALLPNGGGASGQRHQLPAGSMMMTPQQPQMQQQQAAPQQSGGFGGLLMDAKKKAGVNV